MRYTIYLDTETTCLPEESQGNILVQMALAIYDTHEKEMLYMSETYCKPNNQLTSGAMALHHITPEMLVDAKPIEETDTYQLLKDWIDQHSHESVLVAHNLPFDFEALSRVIDFKQARKLDTLKICRMINDNLGLPWKSCALQYLKYDLKLYQKVPMLLQQLNYSKTMSAHDAMSDIIDLILLTGYVMSTYSATIEQMVNITENGPLYLKHMPSGKDRGRLFTDLSYNQLQWHAENSYDESVRFTCNKLLS